MFVTKIPIMCIFVFSKKIIKMNKYKNATKIYVATSAPDIRIEKGFAKDCKKDGMKVLTTAHSQVGYVVRIEDDDYFMFNDDVKELADKHQLIIISADEAKEDYGIF